MAEYKHYRLSVGLATVHLIWIPCRRKKVFYKREDLKTRCATIFQEVAAEKKWFIKAMEIASDHVHLLVEYDPHHSIAQVVKAFKGRSSRILRQEFPELLRLPSLYECVGRIRMDLIQPKRLAPKESWTISMIRTTAE